MGPEEVLIDFVLNVEEAVAKVKTLEDEILVLQGMVDKFHKSQETAQGKREKEWETAAEKMTNATEIMDQMVVTSAAAEKAQDAMLSAAKKGIDGAADSQNKWARAVQDQIMGQRDLKMEIMDLALAATSLQVIWMAMRDAYHATEAVTKTLGYLRVSAALTGQEIKDVTTGIQDAVNATGMAFGEAANKAKMIYDFTGVTDQLGEIIGAGAKINKVFGLNGDEFERMAAFTIKWSKGTVTATQIMEQFDGVVGLTGDRMDAVLNSITEIGRELKKSVGGGAEFGERMLKVTKMTAKLSGLMQQVGGDAQTIPDMIQKAVTFEGMNELIQQMPQLGQSMMDVMAAARAGDEGRFVELIGRAADGAAGSFGNMSEEMKTALAASGINIGLAKEIQGMRDAYYETGGAIADAATVQEKFGALSMDIATTITRIWNNIVTVFMKALQPALEKVQSAFTGLADAMGDGQKTAVPLMEALGGILSVFGWLLAAAINVMTWFVKLTGTGNAVVVMLLGMLAAGVLLRLAMLGIGKAIGTLLKPLVSLGQAVGKAVGKGIGEATEQIGKAAQKTEKNSKAMMKAGVAMILFAGAFLIVAYAFTLFASIPWSGFFMGLVAMAALVVAGLVLAQLSGPLIQGGLALMFLAGAVFILGLAMGLFADAGWKGLAVMVVTIITLVAMAAALTYAAPFIAGGIAVMLGLAYAMIALGVGMLVMAAGVAVFSMAMGMLVSYVPAIFTFAASLLVMAASMAILSFSMPLFIGSMLMLAAFAGPIVAGAMVLAFSLMILGAALFWVAAALDSFGPSAIASGEGMAAMAKGINALADSSYVSGSFALWWIADTIDDNKDGIIAAGVYLYFAGKGLEALGKSINSLAASNYKAAGDAIYYLTSQLSGANWVFLWIRIEGVKDSLGELQALGQMGKIDVKALQNLAALSEQINALPEIDASNFGDSVQQILGIMKDMAKATDDLIKVSNVMESNGDEINRAFVRLFGAGSPLLSAIKNIDEALNPSGWFNDIDIDESNMASFRAIFDIMKAMGDSLVDILTVSKVMQTSSTEISALMVTLFGDGKGKGLLPDAINRIDIALNTGWNITLSPKNIEDIMTIFNIFEKMGNSLQTIIDVGKDLRKNSWIVNTVVTDLFGTGKKADGSGRGGLLPETIYRIDQALNSGSNITLSKTNVRDINAVIDMMVNVSDAYFALAEIGGTFGKRLSNGLTVFKAASGAAYDMFGHKGAIFRKLVWYMADGFSDYKGSHFKGAEEGQKIITKWMSGILDTIEKLAVAGVMMDSIIRGKRLGDTIKSVTEELFNREDGIMPLLSRNLAAGFAGLNAEKMPSPEAMLASLNGTAGAVTSFLKQTQSWGDTERMFEVSEALDYFSGSIMGIAMIQDEMEAVQDTFIKMGAMLRMAGQWPDTIRANLGEDVRIAAEGGAEVAMSEYLQQRRVHEENVETLLAEIRDAVINTAGPSGSNKQVAQMQPSNDFNPANIFAAFGSEGEF